MRRDWDYLLFAGGGGFADYHVTRQIHLANGHNVISRRAKGDHRGGQAAFYGEYGRRGCIGNVSINPYLGLLYMNVTQNAFLETGADALDLAFEKASIDSFRTLLGGQLDFRLHEEAVLLWSVHAVWMHEYLGQATRGDMTAQLAVAPIASFDVAGPNTGRDWIVAGCGVRGALLKERLQPFANFDLLSSINQTFYTAWGGLEYVW